MTSKIKIFGIVGVLILIGLVSYLGKRVVELNHDLERTNSNYENALKIDSLKVAIFKVEKTHELEDLINRNFELNRIVDESGVEVKRIKDLYYQQQRYINKIESKTDVSEIVKDIRNDVSITKQWTDSTECLTIKGFISYANDSLNVGVTSREFKNNVALIKYKGRRKPIKWLLGLRLGERENIFKPQSECGDIKVQIIEKE